MTPPAPTCRLCGGPSDLDRDGIPYPKCLACVQASRVKRPAPVAEAPAPKAIQGPTTRCRTCRTEISTQFVRCAACTAASREEQDRRAAARAAKVQERTETAPRWSVTCCRCAFVIARPNGRPIVPICARCREAAEHKRPGAKTGRARTA